MSEPSWAFEPGSAEARLVDEIRRRTGVARFDLAVVLGSGWGGAAELGERLGEFPYADWPCFPAGQIAGHGGRLVALRVSGWNLLCFVGRFHCYQGLSAFAASFPVRLAGALGTPRLLLTCATGGVNREYRPGDFMLVEDHINLLGDNPLRGLPGNTFVDLATLYARDVYAALTSGAQAVPGLHRGVLAAMPGPSYETPAEIRFLAAAGVDVVSMSTVHEAIMGRFLGMQVAAVAFVANPAAGLGVTGISHEEVLACSVGHAEAFPRLVGRILAAWQALSGGPRA